LELFKISPTAAAPCSLLVSLRHATRRTALRRPRHWARGTRGTASHSLAGRLVRPRSRRRRLATQTTHDADTHYADQWRNASPIWTTTNHTTRPTTGSRGTSDGRRRRDTTAVTRRPHQRTRKPTTAHRGATRPVAR